MSAGVEMILVKQPVALEPDQLEAWRALTEQLVDGMNAQHRKRWKRFLAWVLRVEPGEYLTWFMRRERSTPFHRRHFKIEQEVFDAQEQFADFTQFRLWSCVGAGHVDWLPGGKGMPAIVPIPKSMSYAALDEDGMQELHASMVTFWRSERALKALWPHLRYAAADEMLNRVLQEFGE